MGFKKIGPSPVADEELEDTEEAAEKGPSLYDVHNVF